MTSPQERITIARLAAANQRLGNLKELLEAETQFKYRVATDDGDHEDVVIATNDIEEAKAEFTKQCDRFLDDVRNGIWGEDFLEGLEDGLTIALEEDLSEVLMEKTFYAEDLAQ